MKCVVLAFRFRLILGRGPPSIESVQWSFQLSKKAQGETSRLKSEEDPGAEKVAQYRRWRALAARQRTPLALSGSALYFEALDGSLISFDGSNRTLEFRARTDTSAWIWRAQLPAGFQLAGLNSQGVLLGSVDDPGASLPRMIYALNVRKRPAGKIAFHAIDVEQGHRARWLTGDLNGLVVLTEGTRVHVYDFAQLTAPQPTVRTVDLMTDSQLSGPVSLGATTEALAVQWSQGPDAASDSSTAVVSAQLASPPANASSAPSDAQFADPNRIVKCRDATGSVSIVRGTCPTGTTMFSVLENRTPPPRELTDIERVSKRLEAEDATAREVGESEASRFEWARDYPKARWLTSTALVCPNNRTLVVYVSEDEVRGKPTRFYSGSIVEDRLYYSYAGAVYANCNAGQQKGK